MGSVNGPSCPNPNYQEPPPAPPPQPKPNPSGPPTPQASPTPRRPDVDPPPADQVVPPPAQQQVYNVQAPPPAQKFNSVAEAKACAQQHLTQNLSSQIIAAAPRGTAVTPEFRANAQAFASEMSSRLTESVSTNFPANAPPELLYQTTMAVGDTTGKTSAPLFAGMVRAVGQPIASATPPGGSQPPPNTAALANPNIFSNVDPKAIIADVSGKDDSGSYIILHDAYDKAEKQALANGLSPEEARQKGMAAMTEIVFPVLGNRTASLNFEYKGHSMKLGSSPRQDGWEVRGTLPLMRVPLYNANYGVTFSNNDTNVNRGDNAFGNTIAFIAENQRRNPLIAGGSVILGQTGVQLPAAFFLPPDVTARMTPYLTAHSMGLMDMGNSDAGRYDLGRFQVTAASVDVRLGFNDKGVFGKLQVEHSAEARAFAIQNRNNDGGLDHFTPLFGKVALKGEPLAASAEYPWRATTPPSASNTPVSAFNSARRWFGAETVELSYGAKFDTNAPFVAAGLVSQNPDYFLNSPQSNSGGRAGPTSVSIGRDGTVFNLNDPAQEQAWRSQFNDVPLLLQSMRGSNMGAAGSQLFLANPRTYQNRGIQGANFQTSDQGWFRPGIGQQLPNEYVTGVANDSEDKNADLGDWMRGFVTKPFAWMMRPVDERLPNELAVERPRESAGLPQGMKPIQSTVAELNYTGAMHPRDMSALAYVTEEQMIALNPDKVSYINRPNPTTGQMERVAAFKEGENLILPVATSRSGQLQMLQRATASSGEEVNVPAGKTGTTHVQATPESFYRQQVDFANAYNRAVDHTIAQYGNDKAVLQSKLATLSQAFYNARQNSDGILETEIRHMPTNGSLVQANYARVNLGNTNNTTPIEQLGDTQHSRWIQQQLEKML
jgi:hypothetical protein